MHLIAALLCATLFWHGDRARAADATSNDDAPIPTEWLDKKVSVTEAETRYPGVNDERTKDAPQIAKPFGYQNREWESLKAAMQPGDELWTFASPADSWKHLAGSAGIALVRNGKPIKVIVTIMN